MKRETFRKEKIAGLNVTQVPNKTIVLSFNEETYAEFIEDKTVYKAYVNAWIDAYPELFPETGRLVITWFHKRVRETRHTSSANHHQRG